MRDWAGIDPGNESDPNRRDKDAKIDYFLRDLSRAMRRISDGQVPDGSGDLIADQALSDIYWVLDGRPTNQVGFGGTSPSGTATLSSTQDPTKGFIYFGEDQQTAYDETNLRLGINEPAPAAKLHITTGASDQILRPDATITIGGMANELGNTTNLHNSVNDSSDSTYVTCSSATPGGPTFELAPGNDPGTLTGFTLVARARSTDSDPTNKYINLTITDNLNTTLFTASGVNAARQLTGSFTNYSLAVTFGGSPASWADLRVTIGWSIAGLPTDGNLQLADIYLSIPGSSDTLQKWESSSNTNLLAYELDGNGATTLEFSGTPKLRIATSGLEFDIGTPAAGNIWSASDSEGTGAWVTLGSLLDDDLEAIGALTGTGLLARTADNTWALRTMVAPAAGLTIANPGGVADHPTFALANDLAALEGLASTGSPYRSAADTWALAAPVSGGVLGWTSSTVLASSVLLTANALVLGGGAGATPTPMGSLGTTTTVLHGNAAGAPTFGAVSLTADVSGQLPLGNGGTGINASSVTDLFNQLDPLTTRGDLMTHDGTNSVRLGIGAAATFLQVDAGGDDPAWFDLFGTANAWTGVQTFRGGGVLGDIILGNIAGGDRGILTIASSSAGDVVQITGLSTGNRTQSLANHSGVIVVWNGSGSGLPSAGSLLYGASGSSGMSELTIGASGTILRSNGSAPTWTTATFPDTAGTSQNVLVSDGTNWSSTALSALTTASFKDTVFRIIDATTASNTLLFDLPTSGTNIDLTLAFAGTADRTVTIPDATTTLAGLAVAQTFTKAQTIAPDSDVVPLVATMASGAGSDALQINAFGGSGGNLARIDGGGGIFAQNYNLLGSLGHIGQIAGNVTSDPIWTFPDASGGVLITTATQTMSAKTINSSTIGVTTEFNSSTSSSGAAFQDVTTATKQLRFILSGASANNHTITVANTAARDYKLENVAGTVVVVGNEAAAPSTNNLGKVDRTGITAVTAATNLTSATAVVGCYAVHYEMTTTANTGGDGTLTFNVIATGDMGALTTPSAANLNLATANDSIRGTIFRYVASGALQYSTTLAAGAYTAATTRTALRVRVEFLGA